MVPAGASLRGADLLGETLAKLDVITPRPQHDRDATFAPLLKKQDGFIDWTSNAATIERCVRGFQPWPTAYTHHKSHRLIVWRATAEESSLDGSMGEVVVAHGDHLVVKCGDDTALRLIEVQPEAKRRMDVRDFLNGTHLKVGDRFGEV
jgi:methionyl-tRNA formyltransferase